MARRAPKRLCAECSEADLCDRPEKCGDFVLECETFRRRGGGAVPVDPGPRPLTSEERRAAKEVSLGLCRTCSHQRVCAYLEKKGGVWHCEEFSPSE
jgi:hypothetical protein